MKLVIIDYGIGNLGSVKNMLAKVGVKAVVSSDHKEILTADKLILPGVGRFDYGMSRLTELDLVNVISEIVNGHKTPILGICLGAQLLTEFSEEGNCNGLGFIKGKTVAFNKAQLGSNLKVPHMGWNEVKGYEKSRLFNEMFEEPRFYFVHSYHFEINDPVDVISYVDYGYTFPVAIEKENVMGVQFHPEKSHKYGMKLLENFIKYY